MKASDIDFNTEGKKFDDGKVMMNLLYPDFLIEMGRKLTEGYQKYGYKNYMNGLDKERIKAAAFRHLIQVLNDDNDDEGYDARAAVAVNMMMLFEIDVERRKNVERENR